MNTKSRRCRTNSHRVLPKLTRWLKKPDRKAEERAVIVFVVAYLVALWITSVVFFDDEFIVTSPTNGVTIFSSGSAGFILWFGLTPLVFGVIVFYLVVRPWFLPSRSILGTIALITVSLALLGGGLATFAFMSDKESIIIDRSARIVTVETSYLLRPSKQAAISFDEIDHIELTLERRWVSGSGTSGGY